MRVAIDATSIYAAVTGVERVVLECTRALLQEAPSIEWHVYVRPRFAPVFAPLGAQIHVIAGLQRPTRVLWQQTVLPLLLRGLRPDILLAPAYTAPLLAPCPVLLFVHDLLAFQRPELCSRLNVLHFRALMMESIRRAACVVVPSRYVAAAVAAFVRPASEPLVLEHGITGEFLRERAASDEKLHPARRTLSGGTSALPSRYLLTVGRVERRKNQHLVLESLALLSRRGFADLGLVVVGSSGPGAGAFARHLRSSPVRERVRLLQNVQDPELARLYAGATMLVYPSAAEGFGIPPLESLAMGTPALVSRFTPSYVERWGEDRWVLLQLDPESIASCIESILKGSDGGEVTARRQELRGLTWKRHARILSARIQSLPPC